MQSDESTTSAKTLLLFVYGTLMHDGCRHHVLAGQRFLGTARTEPLYVMLDLGAYPGLVSVAAEGASIEGEIYELPPNLLPLLDEIEGVPDLYQLDRIRLEGIETEVYTYFYRRNPLVAPHFRNSRWDDRRSRSAP